MRYPKLPIEERKRRQSERSKRHYSENRDKYVKYERVRRKERYEIKKGIELYLEVMTRFYHKEHRQRCYQQLREDFKNMQRHLQVA